MADPVATQAWIDYYNSQKGVTAVALSCKKPSDVARVPKLAMQVAPHRGTALKPLRMMIMGIPNVGKSTLMNALLKKRVAAVGDEPAVTKTQQRLYLGNNMVLTDTPGMLWPKIEHPSDGLMLAASHAVGSNALIEEEVATFLADLLLQRYPQLLKARYGFNTDGMDGVAVVEGGGQARLPSQGRRLRFREGRAPSCRITAAARWAASRWRPRNRVPSCWRPTGPPTIPMPCRPRMKRKTTRTMTGDAPDHRER
jgi:hypothetical protein